MKCIEFAALLDGYFDGKISEDRLDAFELHYFECDSCFRQLKMVERLRSNEVHVVASATDAVASGGRWRIWKPVLTFAFVLLALIFPAMHIMDHIHSTRMEFFFQITDVPAPAYLKGEIRGPANQALPGEQLFQEAMIRYNKKEYGEALELLNRIPEQGQDREGKPNPRILFFKGICYLYSGKLEPAITTLNMIIEAMNPSYYDEAIYYKAIALLRMGEKADAKEQLNHLAGMFSPLAPKAKGLLEKLD